MKTKLPLLSLVLATLLILPYMSGKAMEFEDYDCGACVRDHHSLCEDGCIDHAPEQQFACLHDCQKVSCASICSPAPEETPAQQQDVSGCKSDDADCSKSDKETKNDPN